MAMLGTSSVRCNLIFVRTNMGRESTQRPVNWQTESPLLPAWSSPQVHQSDEGDLGLPDRSAVRRLSFSFWLFWLFSFLRAEEATVTVPLQVATTGDVPTTAVRLDGAAWEGLADLADSAAGLVEAREALEGSEDLAEGAVEAVEPQAGGRWANGKRWNF
jgi:hypothetical protein